jgi:hypothetical protein
MENEAQVPTQFSLWVAGKPSAPLDLPMALGGDCFAIAKRESAIEVAQYVAMQFPESFRRVAVKPSDFFYHLGFNPEIQKVKLVFNGMVALAKACDAHQLRWEDVVIATTIAQGGPVRAPAQAIPVGADRPR